MTTGRLGGFRQSPVAWLSFPFPLLPSARRRNHNSNHSRTRRNRTTTALHTQRTAAHWCTRSRTPPAMQLAQRGSQLARSAPVHLHAQAGCAASTRPWHTAAAATITPTSTASLSLRASTSLSGAGAARWLHWRSGGGGSGVRRMHQCAAPTPRPLHAHCASTRTALSAFPRWTPAATPMRLASSSSHSDQEEASAAADGAAQTNSSHSAAPATAAADAVADSRDDASEFGPPLAPMPSSLSASQRRAVLAMMSLHDLRRRYAETFPVRRGEVRDSLEDVGLKREWMDMQMQAQMVGERGQRAAHE